MSADGAAEFYQSIQRSRRPIGCGIPLSPSARAVLAALPRVPGRPYVFTNAGTGDRYTVNGALHVFRRAVRGVRTGDGTLHTLRHTAISRMIAKGHNDHVVMAISGHSSTRMLERYTHPTDERKLEAVDTFAVGTKWAHPADAPEDPLAELRELLGKVGGRQEARTPDLRVANAALSQLS
jgi:Phage integrase family